MAAEIQPNAGIVPQRPPAGLVSQTNGTVTIADVNSSVVRNIRASTSLPLSSDGNNGDIWLVY